MFKREIKMSGFLGSCLNDYEPIYKDEGGQGRTTSSSLGGTQKGKVSRPTLIPRYLQSLTNNYTLIGLSVAYQALGKMSRDKTKGVLRKVLADLKVNSHISDRDISLALSELRRDFYNAMNLISDENYKLEAYALLKWGIENADEDLFLACEEHDSLRKLAYNVVKLMDSEELGRVAKRILAQDLERTLLGSYIMRRAFGGRGGGT